MAQLMSNMNTAVFKLPLGMMRLIEFPMAILAFATTSGYSGDGSYGCSSCKTPIPNTAIKFGYTFDLTGIHMKRNFCATADPNDLNLFSEGFVSQSQFFVFTGVISFLYILAIVAVYLLFWSLYENDARFPMGDFVVTAILSLFWFAGSCAWASGVTGLKEVTSKSEIAKTVSKHGCLPIDTVVVNDSWNYASLNVSLIAGFACVGLWIANLWFIYKETAWFKARASAGAAAGGPQPGMPPAGGTPQTPNQPTW